MSSEEYTTGKSTAIYDVVVEVDIGSETIGNKITEVLNGKLEAVIISVKDQPVNLGIYFYPQTDIQILEAQQLIGDEYCSVRTDTYTERYEKFNSSQDRWSLNNALYIQIEGNPGSKATLTFRMCRY